MFLHNYTQRSLLDTGLLCLIVALLRRLASDVRACVCVFPVEGIGFMLC